MPLENTINICFNGHIKYIHTHIPHSGTCNPYGITRWLELNEHGATFASLNHLINSIMGPLSIFFRVALLPNRDISIFSSSFRFRLWTFGKRSAAQIIDFSLAVALSFFLSRSLGSFSRSKNIHTKFLFGIIPRYICMPSTITKFNSSVNISFVCFLRIRFCGSSIYQHWTRNETEDVFHGKCYFWFSTIFFFNSGPKLKNRIRHIIGKHFAVTAK